MVNNEFIVALRSVQTDMISKHAKEGYFFTPATAAGGPAKWRKVSIIEQLIRLIFSPFMNSTAKKCNALSTKAFATTIQAKSAKDYETQLSGVVAISPMPAEFDAKIKSITKDRLNAEKIADLEQKLKTIEERCAVLEMQKNGLEVRQEYVNGLRADIVKLNQEAAVLKSQNAALQAQNGTLQRNLDDEIGFGKFMEARVNHGTKGRPPTWHEIYKASTKSAQKTT
jgi:hypothetical protein